MPLRAWAETKDQVGVLIIFPKEVVFISNGMLSKNYIRQLDLFCRHYASLDIWKDDKLAMQYNIVSASLLNFLPDIDAT